MEAKNQDESSKGAADINMETVDQDKSQMEATRGRDTRETHILFWMLGLSIGATPDDIGTAFKKLQELMAIQSEIPQNKRDKVLHSRSRKFVETAVNLLSVPTLL